MTSLLLPVKPNHIASFDSHMERRPKSTEPGTDLFVPIGTRVVAPDDGRVYAVGNTIGPMTGRWIGIDMNNGMRFRCMHHSEILLKPGKLVERGEDIAISGASGYGYEDWSKRSDMPGAHTHATLWPTHASRYGYDRNGNPYSIDLMKYIGNPAGGGSTGEDDMFTDEDRKTLDTLAAMLYAGGPSASKETYLGAEGTIYRFLAQPVSRAVDGVVKKIPQIQDNADTNTLVRVLLVRQAATDAALKALAASNGTDPEAISALIETAVRDAMKGITFSVDIES